MNDRSKTKEQLVEELAKLRRSNLELEEALAERARSEEALEHERALYLAPSWK